jgi:nucleoside-diphosphate-sugar epimerase
VTVERWLVTGALGCIGAWIARTLVREGIPVVAFDLADDDARLRLIMAPEERERVTLIRGDVTDLAQVERALDEHGVTHVVHLAALLIPLARADPPHGALVNVVGTTNVFEAVRRRADRIGGLVSVCARTSSTGPDATRA